MRDREVGQGAESSDDDDKYEASIKHAHPLRIDYHQIGEHGSLFPIFLQPFMAHKL